MQLDGSGGVIGSWGFDVIRADLETGHVTPIASFAPRYPYGLALSSASAFVAVTSATPASSSDIVARLNLVSGQLTPVFTGLQRPIDVAFDTLGRRLVLDQCLSPTPCAGSPVVYRENDAGTLEPLSIGGSMFAPAHFVVLPDPLAPPDLDGDGIGDPCECGDQTGDGRVNVLDLVAINAAIFNPGQAKPLCDSNFDGHCNVDDIVRANLKIFGRPAYCSRYPPPK